jgi:hypothetical protein
VVGLGRGGSCGDESRDRVGVKEKKQKWVYDIVCWVYDMYNAAWCSEV